MQSSSEQVNTQTGLQMNRAKSSFIAEAEGAFPTIVNNLIKQLKSKNIKVKVGVMKTFSVLAHISQKELENHLTLLIPYIEQCVKENNNDYIT